METRSHLRRGLAVVTASACALAGLAVVAPSADAASSTLVINEVYARGGSANQPYTTKFVEILNVSAAPIALTGYGLSYSSATNTGLGNTCALGGVTLPAGGYHVVAVGSNGSTGAALEADQTCTNINPSGTNGSFTLLQGESVVDLVGWGTAKRFEGAAATYTGGNTTPGSIARLPNGADTDANDTDFTFVETPTPGASNTGTTEPEPEPTAVTIAAIQGTGASTPLDGQRVFTKGVVTAVYPTGGFNGIYIQTPGTGGTAKAPGDASDGIFVFLGRSAEDLEVEVGQCVDVEGTAGEYYGLTQLSEGPVVTKATEACAPVKPTPLATLPKTDAEKEAYEGMLVLPQGEYTITNNYSLNQYGQIGLTPGTEPLWQATDVVEPGPEALAYEMDNQARYITLDDGSSWNYMSNKAAQNSPLPYLSHDEPMRTASQVTFTKPVILDYRFQWNYQPTGQIVGAMDADDPLQTENDREFQVPEVGGNIQIAAFNVLNYFTDLGEDEKGCRYYADMYGDPVATNYCEVRGAWSQEAFEAQKSKILAALAGTKAEVVALMEIENSAGISYIDHHRDWTLEQLVNSLNEAAGETRWAYAESPVVTPGTEDIIRTAFIYDPNVVDVLGPSLIQLDDAFANARYPLAQKFKAKKTGKPFTAIANHFKSKGSGEDDGTGQGLSNGSREEQARALTAWASEMFGDEATFLMGDFNAYSRETPVQIIEDAGYTNTAKKFEPSSATYQFSGRLGSLDHVFANAEAMRLVTGAAVWDINGDESIAFQYSRRHYNIVDFHLPNAFASSDHDPIVVGLDTGNRGNAKGKGKN